jgi:hypothetical protein
MKRFSRLYLFTLLCTMGCGSNSELTENWIRVEFRDTVPHVYKLLAVREATLIVGEDISDSITRAHTLPISRIERIYHASNAKVTWMLIGGVAGVLGTTLVIGTIAANESGSGGLAVAVAGGVFGLPAMIIGGVIGHSIPDDEIVYDPHDESDRKSLRDISRYPHGEPPELYNLR